MVQAMLRVLRLFVTVGFFELAGSGAIVAGVWVVAGSVGWALIVGGALGLVKAFDLALGEAPRGTP